MGGILRWAWVDGEYAIAVDRGLGWTLSSTGPHVETDLAELRAEGIPKSADIPASEVTDLRTSYTIRSVVSVVGTVYRADSEQDLAEALAVCQGRNAIGPGEDVGPAIVLVERIHRREDGSDGEREVLSESVA